MYLNSSAEHKKSRKHSLDDPLQVQISCPTVAFPSVGCHDVVTVVHQATQPNGCNQQEACCPSLPGCRYSVVLELHEAAPAAARPPCRPARGKQ